MQAIGSGSKEVNHTLWEIFRAHLQAGKIIFVGRRRSAQALVDTLPGRVGRGLGKTDKLSFRYANELLGGLVSHGCLDRDRGGVLVTPTSILPIADCLGVGFA